MLEVMARQHLGLAWGSYQSSGSKPAVAGGIGNPITCEELAVLAVPHGWMACFSFDSVWKVVLVGLYFLEGTQ